MFNNMSGDDANSTQLEGKKLKKRGVVVDGKYLHIEEDSPALMEDLSVDEGPEYFIERDFDSKESPEEKAERLKKEKFAAQLLQKELAKQQIQQTPTQAKDPNLKLDEIEQGLIQSQNEGKPINENKFKMEEKQLSKDEKKELDPSEKGSSRKNDLAGAYMAIGDNVKTLDFKDAIPSVGDQKKYDLEKSIPAQQLPDVRDKAAEKGPQDKGGGRDM